MIRNVLLTGGPTHDFEATSAALVQLLDEHDVATTVVDEPAAAVAALGGDGGAPPHLLTVQALRWRMEQPRYAQLRDAFAAELTDEEARRLTSFVHGGGALLALHTAVICFDGIDEWRDLCGATWDWERSSHPPVGSCRVTVTEAGRSHPVTSGLDDFVIEDEMYGFLSESAGLVPLLTGNHGGRDHPLLWARSVGEGRVVTDLLGHGVASFEHPAHRRVLAEAVRWATAPRATRSGREPRGAT